MGFDINPTTQMQKIGGLLAHAESAQATVDKGLAAQAEGSAQIMKLKDIATETFSDFKLQIDLIVPRAQQAAEGAVYAEVQRSLQGVGAVVKAAATEALRPVMEEAKERIRQAQKAEWSLAQKAEWFSNRVLAILVIGALGALMVVPIDVFVELPWRRYEFASIDQKTDDIHAKNEKMLAQYQQLKAKGLLMDLRTCKGPKGHLHYCVAVEPFTKQFGTDQAPYREMKGS